MPPSYLYLKLENRVEAGYEEPVLHAAFMKRVGNIDGVLILRALRVYVLYSSGNTLRHTHVQLKHHKGVYMMLFITDRRKQAWSEHS